MAGTQTRTWQRKVIDGATKAGEIGDLYWFVEMDLPSTIRPAQGARYLPATYPPGFVPVIAAGPDPAEQREYAEILALLFETSNRGRMIEFNPTLTDRQTLAAGKFYWYEYGDTPDHVIDHVCDRCGSIRRGPVLAPPACECEGW